MKKDYVTIDPSCLEIDGDTPFRYRRFLPGEAAPAAGRPADDVELARSIERCGLLHPPLLLEESGGRRVVVCGHRRIAAACIAGIHAIEAVSIEAPLEEIIPLWLEDARFGAPLSDLELIMLISRCRALSGERIDSATDRLSEVAGRNLSLSYMERVERLLELPGDILDALHDGLLSTGDLLLLSESKTIDTIRAAGLLAGAALKRAERREAVRLLLRLGDLGIFDEFEEARIGREDDETLGKQENGLLSALRVACHPSLERDIERIDEIVKRLGLPPAASLQPAGNLEGGDYRLIMRIRDEVGLEELLDKFRTALERGDIGRLLGILKGK
jgi:ParB-like chromosome segregation protein Spo0J